MTVQITCPHCAARLESRKEQPAPAKCPFCQKRLPTPKKSVFRADNPGVADDWQPKRSIEIEKKRPRRWPWVAALLLVILTTAALVVIPPLLPKDPREVVIHNFLQAVREGNTEEAAKWGVVDRMPATADHGRGQWLQDLDSVTEGSFAEIAEFTRKIAQKYQRRGKVFILKDQTGQLAKLINKREEIKKKQEEIYNPPRKRGQSESDRLFDMAENMARSYESVFDMVLGGPKHESITATYEQILEQEGTNLTAAQRELLESYEEHPERWDKLMQPADFLTLNEQGQFKLEKSTWQMNVWLPNQSSGEAPVVVQFELVRFRVGLVDTGWKVWDYRTVP